MHEFLTEIHIKKEFSKLNVLEINPKLKLLRVNCGIININTL